jgi:hypothetical protein
VIEILLDEKDESSVKSIGVGAHPLEQDAAS